MLSLVGGGGKTCALGLLAGELASGGGRVMVTTTTAMYQRDLAAVGPLAMNAADMVLAAELRETLGKGLVAAAARASGADGKVVGLPPATVDRLWADGLADYVVVEADGSRGMSLKAFGPYEPQVPGATTTIVTVAGLDAIGKPLTAQYVHRADLLAAMLGVPGGITVTLGLFVDTLREQIRQLREGWPARRIIVLLNKADDGDAEELGKQVARELLGGTHDADGPSLPGELRGPDAVIVASLRRGTFARFSAEGR